MKQHLRIALSAMVLTICATLPSMAAANDIFVSTTGNDGSGDGTVGNPYATIERACDFVGPGDTIYLRGGVYTGVQHKVNPWNPSQNGSASSPITVTGYDGEEVVLDGTGVDLGSTGGLLIVANWNEDPLTYFIIDGLVVRNSSARGISYYKTEHLIIRNCTVHDIQDRAIGGWGLHVTIEDNEVYNAGLENENGQMGNGGWPMMIYGAEDYDSGDPSVDLTIRNNYVHNCWGEAIGPGVKSCDVLIEGNTIRDVFSVGIYVDKATQTVIRNNHIYSTDPAYYRFDRPATGIGMANETSFSGGYSHVQDIEITNNLLAKCGKAVNYWHDSSNGNANNTYSDIVVAYNTIVEPTYRGIFFDDVPSSNTQPTGCVLKNNIVESGSDDHQIYEPTGWDISHNCWPDGVPSLDSSANSFAANPSFLAPAVAGGADGYRLSSRSFCQDAGTPLAAIGIDIDRWDTARDSLHPAVGMHEPCFDIFYVDASASASGDGKSRATAFKTIGEATSSSLAPGDIVYIQPGVYEEDAAIDSNGAQTVPVTTGVSVSDTDKISFPSGTDLSGIDLASHPEQYYAYVYRSINSNNGFYKIALVDDDNDYVRVEDADFIQESGTAGDISRLSASVGRPVVYKKYSDDPENERVVIDCENVPEAYTMLYIGDYIDPYHANPADYNIVDGIDVRNGPGGIAIQCSSHNVYANGKIYDTEEAIGCIIDGNQDHPANYNFVINYEIRDVIGEGIYIGAGDNGEYYNQTHCNHIVGNEIHMSGATDELENAIDVKEYNQANVIERNTIRHFKLMSQANGAIEIRDRAHFTLVYDNILKDIVGTGSSGDTEYVLNVYPETQNVWVFNNLIYRTAANQDYVYAVNLEGKNTSGNLFAHNTIHNMDLGILLQNYGTGVDFTVANNIFDDIRGRLINEWTNTGSQEGRFTLSNNLFDRDPNLETYSTSPEFIGEPNFEDPAAENFRLTAQSDKAVDTGATLSIAPADFDRHLRNISAPDLGALEYGASDGSIHQWLGYTQDWSDSQNWPGGTIPGDHHNVLIPASPQEGSFPHACTEGFSPIGSLCLEAGAEMTVPAGETLIVHGAATLYVDGISEGTFVIQGALTMD